MVGMKICIISILLILISHSFSQPKKISGIVLDAKKQVPVEGANVFIRRIPVPDQQTPAQYSDIRI